MEFLKHLFASDGFMPHGYCYLWNPGLVWLHVTSDSLLAAAYLSIPLTLIYFVRRRQDSPFHRMFLCFGTFIIASGATHIMEVWNLWNADYRLTGFIKGVTALASVFTVILLIPLIPQALAMPSPGNLQRPKQKFRGLLEAALDGEEALDFLFCRGSHSDGSFVSPPKFVVLDLKLPKVHGLQVLREVKSDDRTNAIPVSILTSCMEDRDLVESHKLGVNSYIQKPVDFNQFRGTVKELGLYWMVVNQLPPPNAFTGE
jgi:CheY-like chemotaxis protein